MDPRDDARLRLAARRHPASPSAGSLHFAQYQLSEVTNAFVVLMAAAGNPGVAPIPPPAGRDQWPRRHQARSVLGWPVVVVADGPFDDWIDVSGAWWRLRYDPSGALLDAHPLGRPMTTARELTNYADALDDILRAHDLRD